VAYTAEYAEYRQDDFWRLQCRLLMDRRGVESLCEVARNRECQRKDWKEHKKVRVERQPSSEQGPPPTTAGDTWLRSRNTAIHEQEFSELAAAVHRRPINVDAYTLPALPARIPIVGAEGSSSNGSVGSNLPRSAKRDCRSADGRYDGAR